MTGVLRTLPRRFAAAAASAIALASAALSPAAAHAQAASPTAPAASRPAGLVLAPCRLPGLEHDAQCGILRRPLDPNRPAGTQIDLHVAVIPAIARQKKPDPVFFLAGGPGQSAIDLAGTIARLAGRLVERRDLVLVDQRGTGRSAPLECPGADADEALARALDRTRMVAAFDRCRAHLQSLPHGDLRQYTTTIAMGDLDAVRAAMGAERIDLIGVSYGTRAALEYLRLYPGHVRRAVLDAVAPPDMVLPVTMGLDQRAALQALFDACRDMPSCAKAHPDLAARWQAFLGTLPRAFDVHDPATGRPLHLVLNRDVVANLVRPALYSAAIGAVLPHAIEEAVAGRLDPLLAASGSLGGPGGLDLAEGMHFSVVCSEDAGRLPPATADEDGSIAMYRQVCATWPRGDVPEAFRTTPATASPVLLLSGSIDPVTPPAHAARVAKALGPNARHVVVPNSAHGALSLPCVHDAALRFIDLADDAQALRVDLSCAAALPRPLPFTPPLPARAASGGRDGLDLAGRATR